MGRTFTAYLNSRVNKHYFAFFVALCLMVSLVQAQVAVTVTGTNLTCFNGNNGTATAVGSGGWAPYVYQWSNGATTATITGLPAGTYQVTVTDIDLGYAIGSITLNQPPAFGVLVQATQPQLCGIAPDGVMTAVPYGGVGPYTYLWNNGQTTPVITGLSAGTYVITVTDVTGCTAVGSGVILYNPEGIWLGDSTKHITCKGLNNGFIHVGAMTGTPPYSILWNNGSTSFDLFNLAPGFYSGTVTDANGCTAVRNITITEPPLLTGSGSSTNANCGLTGSATVTPSGGTPPYSILWNTGATSNTISVMPGTYTATVTDANGCTAATTVIVGGSTSTITVNTSILVNAGCTIGGSASATVSGGTGNYAYSWDNGQTTSTATNLIAGPHKVTVTDITTGCQGIGNVNIPTAPQLTVGTTLVANATCLTGGSATASASGGTAPYTYKWDNNQTTATATNLAAGPHTVTVTDAGGCVATAMISIGQSQGPNVSTTVISNATCTTGGSASVTATGSGGYVYLWDNGQTTTTATNLTPGPHKVTVTDGAGCATIGMVNITQPGAPSVVVASSTNSSCSTPSGAVTVAASGGTPNYTYKWSNNATTASLTNLSPGTYTVTVTDAAGCTTTTAVSIASSLPPNVVISASSNAKCDQPGSATATATNGTGTLTYKWDNGEMTATAVNLSAGVHTVTVTDAAGCTATASVTIGFSGNGISIGDYVWYDNDQDGFQHPLETAGVSGMTVMLIRAGNDGIFGTADDVTVQTTTTNANGIYEFDCVTPGTYIIMFSGLPAGYEFTDKDAVNNDCKDSDAGSNGKTSPFTIAAGQPNNFCFDAGIHIKCDNVTNAGTICCSQTICEGDIPAALYGVAPPTGGSGTIEYQWLQLIQIGPAPPTWMPVAGATSATYQPGALYETSYFMRCARRAGCISFLESNYVTITVNPAGTPGCLEFIMNLNVIQHTPTTTLVSWTTLPEADDYLYDVQYSIDLKNWQELTTVMGLHNEAEPNKYAYEHKTPLMGKNFYRIKRTTASNLSTFSGIVDIDLANELEIKPTLVIDQLQISSTVRQENGATIELVSPSGRTLQTNTIDKGAILQTTIQMFDYPSGIYFLRIRYNNNEVKTIKITKI
jgi:hypothetical protein